MKTISIKKLSAKVQQYIIKEVPSAKSINYEGESMSSKPPKWFEEWNKQVYEKRRPAWFEEFYIEFIEFKQEMYDFREQQMKFNNLLLSLPTIKKEITAIKDTK